MTADKEVTGRGRLLACTTAAYQQRAAQALGRAEAKGPAVAVGCVIAPISDTAVGAGEAKPIRAEAAVTSRKRVIFFVTGHRFSNQFGLPTGGVVNVSGCLACTGDLVKRKRWRLQVMMFFLRRQQVRDGGDIANGTAVRRYLADETGVGGGDSRIETEILFARAMITEGGLGVGG